MTRLFLASNPSKYILNGWGSSGASGTLLVSQKAIMLVTILLKYMYKNELMIINMMTYVFLFRALNSTLRYIRQKNWEMIIHVCTCTFSSL